MSFQGFMFKVMAGRSDKKRDANLVEPADVISYKDIPYVANGDKYNLLDVYRPKDAEGKLPVIVSIHGGGYVYGTKEIYKHYGMYLAQQGFVFVNFNYHLAPKHKFPTPLVEANLVMEWLVEHAEEYDFDINNVFVVGDSAGAQLLSQYATIHTNPEYEKLFPFQTPKEVQIRAIALNCGIYKMDAVDMGGLKTDYFTKNPEQFGEMLDVVGHITEAYPPTYVMTSYYDFLKENAKPMYELLKEKGISTEWKCYGTEGQEYMGHVCHVNMNLKEAKEINQDECNFFRKFAKNP